MRCGGNKQQLPLCLGHLTHGHYARKLQNQNKLMTDDNPQGTASQDDDNDPEDARQRRARLGVGVEDVTKLLRLVVERNFVAPDTFDRLLEAIFRLLNRREVVERLLKSEFMKSVRDRQSEITEALGLASQADVEEMRTTLRDVIVRLERLQKTLDEIVVEVDEA